jgi:peptidyl-prolyl cis-trans isomerase SurA
MYLVTAVSSDQPQLAIPTAAAALWRAIAAGLLLMLGAGMLQAKESVDRIVAVVNEDIVLDSEVERQIQRFRAQMREQGQTLPPDEVIRQQMLERMVLTRLQQQLAERTGIRVDDEAVNRAIGDIAGRNKVSVDEFKQIIARDGYDYEAFRDDIRTEIMIARLRQRDVDNLVTVTDREIENFLATRGAEASAETEFHIQHILVATSAENTPEEIEAIAVRAAEAHAKAEGEEDFGLVAAEYSDAGQTPEEYDLGWRKESQLPSIFAPVVPRLAAGAVSEVFRSPNGFHIVKLLETRGSAQHIVKQTRARHILVRTGEAVSTDDARTRLSQLRARILGGEDFADLARSNSDDRGSSIKGGDLGWVSPGDMVPEFEQVMNTLADGEVSEPFASQFGWHLMQVLEHRDYDGTEEVRRSQARETIRKRKLDEEREAWLRRLRDEAYVEFREP